MADALQEMAVADGEHGRQTQGEWYVDDADRFCSFWPTVYRACYSLRWIVEGGAVVGLRFTDLQGGSRLDGRYGIV